MSEANNIFTIHGGTRQVRTIGKPRHIAGGSVIEVAWVEDDQTQKLADGSIHPARRAGFAWSEPVCNLKRVPTVAS